MRASLKYMIWFLTLVITFNFPVAAVARESSSGVEAESRRKDRQQEAESRREDRRQGAESRREDRRQEASVDRLHKLGTRLINQRIKVINKSIKRVNKATAVPEIKRAIIIADLNDNIGRLTELKKAIDADTNIDSLKVKVRSIYTDFRIYAVLLPRDRALLAAGRTGAVLGKLSILAAKIDRWLAAANGSGKDTTAVTVLIAEFKQNLAAAEANVAQAITYFSLMEPAKDTSMAKENLEAGKKSLKDARQNLKNARQDLQKIVREFKGLRLGTLKIK